MEPIAELYNWPGLYGQHQSLRLHNVRAAQANVAAILTF